MQSNGQNQQQGQGSFLTILPPGGFQNLNIQPPSQQQPDEDTWIEIAEGVLREIYLPGSTDEEWEEWATPHKARLEPYFKTVLKKLMEGADPAELIESGRQVLEARAMGLPQLEDKPTENGWFIFNSVVNTQYGKSPFERILDMFRGADVRSRIQRMRMAYTVDIGTSIFGGIAWAQAQMNPDPGHYIFAIALTVGSSFSEYLFIDGWQKRRQLSKALGADPENINARLGLWISWVEQIFGFLGWLLDLYTTALWGATMVEGEIGVVLGLAFVVITTVFEFEYHLAEEGLLK